MAKSPIVQNEAGGNVASQPVWLAGAVVTLAAGVDLTAGDGSTPVTEVAGGAYLISMTAAAWNGAALKLQHLGPDETTWLDALSAAGTAASLSANGTTNAVVGANATLRLLPTGGNPTGVFARAS